MEDIIPIIIVAIISIIGAASKKKRQNAQGNMPNERPSFLQNLFDDDTPDIKNVYYNNNDADETIDAVPETEPIAPSTKATDTVAKNQDLLNDKFNSYKGFLSPEETTKMKEQEGSSFMHKQAVDQKNSPSSILKEETQSRKKQIPFNLKKAVIYNEILNRKYT